MSANGTFRPIVRRGRMSVVEVRADISRLPENVAEPPPGVNRRYLSRASACLPGQLT
jgi:hypothetical protein